jgi:hypothetical protein
MLEDGPSVSGVPQQDHLLETIYLFKDVEQKHSLQA